MRLVSLAFIAVLAACTSAHTPDTLTGPGDVSEVTLIAQGKDLATGDCAGCHTLSATGASPRPDAPPLRVVLATYDPSALADDFRDGIHIGHQDMPDFDYGARETDALLAYLASIQTDK